MLIRAWPSDPVTDLVNASAGHVASKHARDTLPSSRTASHRVFEIGGSGIRVAIAPATRTMALAAVNLRASDISDFGWNARNVLVTAYSMNTIPVNSVAANPANTPKKPVWRAKA